PGSALHALLPAPAKARWPGALLAAPPGWLHESFWRGGGNMIGLSAAARLLVAFSCWITDTRLPGKGTGFSAKGLTSSSLGRLGKLMPTKASAQPASVKTHKSETPTAPSPLPSLPTLPL